MLLLGIKYDGWENPIWRKNVDHCKKDNYVDNVSDTLCEPSKISSTLLRFHLWLWTFRWELLSLLRQCQWGLDDFLQLTLLMLSLSPTSLLMWSYQWKLLSFPKKPTTFNIENIFQTQIVLVEIRELPPTMSAELFELHRNDRAWKTLFLSSQLFRINWPSYSDMSERLAKLLRYVGEKK